MVAFGRTVPTFAIPKTPEVLAGFLWVIYPRYDLKVRSRLTPASWPVLSPDFLLLNRND
jgi:hypothetical protein